MVRPRRLWSPEHFHHVTGRGNWRDTLFREERDYHYFLSLIHKMHVKFGITLACYCMMTNHYHLLIHSPTTHLSIVMGRINKAYADYYNYQYNVSGHLFEKRFYSDPIFDPIGVAEVGRYIHRNPIEAHIVRNPQEYIWSSYRYLHQPPSASPPYLDQNPLLDPLPYKTYEEKIQYYRDWVQQDSQYKV